MRKHENETGPQMKTCDPHTCFKVLVSEWSLQSQNKTKYGLEQYGSPQAHPACKDGIK